MSQSLAQVYLHIVFSTKNRLPMLSDPVIRGEMHKYLATIANNLGCHAIEVGGVEDHVHLLCNLSRTVTIAKLLQDLKRDSSLWIKERDKTFNEFHWQAGYGAFSVSRSQREDVRYYIQRQEERHKQESYQDEFRRICKLYDIEIDERYVWD